MARESSLHYVLVTSRRGDVEVVWQARAQDSGRFRLLRGPDLLSLEVISEQPARGGDQDYRFTDRHRVGDGCLYELWYVDHQGRELFLGTIFCREAGAGPAPALPAAHYEAIDLSPGLSVAVPQRIDSVTAQTRVRELPWNLVPLVPPPEGRDSVGGMKTT